jgi:hypothetical protein
MNAFLRETHFSRCGKLPSWPVPHLERAPVVTPPKTSMISGLPYVARWGAAKHGTECCRTAAPAAPPFRGEQVGRGSERKQGSPPPPMQIEPIRRWRARRRPCARSREKCTR